MDAQAETRSQRNSFCGTSPTPEPENTHCLPIGLIPYAHHGIRLGNLRVVRTVSAIPPGSRCFADQFWFVKPDVNESAIRLRVVSVQHAASAFSRIDSGLNDLITRGVLTETRTPQGALHTPRRIASWSL